MRVLLLAGSYPPEIGGIAQFMHSFVKGLTARGVEVDIIANPPLPRGYFKRVETCRQELLKKLRLHAADRIVVSSWSPYAVPLPLSHLDGSSEIPFDVFCHGMDLLEPSHSLRYRMLMKRTLRRTSRVLANSHYTANLAIEFGANRDSVVVLHPCVDSGKFTPGTRAGMGRPTILSVGRLVERKGFDMVLRAMPRILQRFPEARYICAGEGPDQVRLEQLVKELNIVECVEWPGAIDEAEKVRLFQSADVFVMPNRITEADGSVEGFGIVFLEAAACELPVIAGSCGGAPDAVVNGETGFLVNPIDVDEVAARLIQLLGDDALRKSLGLAARRRVTKDFREEQIAERYLASL